MIVIPIIIAAGTWILTTISKTYINKQPSTSVGATVPRITRAGVITVKHEEQPRFRKMLVDRMRSGGRITRWLLDSALLEAFNSGDIKTVNMLISIKRRRASSVDNQPNVETLPEPESQESQDDGHDENNEGNVESSGEELPSEPTLKSPLRWVDDDSWQEFVSRARTKPVGHASEKYVGQFEQSRQRLSSLGSPIPQTPDEEYKLFCEDISRHAQDSDELISRWSGDVVTINGEEHVICASGILGLLKSAGHKGAESWLQNDVDRKQFPKTTEAFLRTNNCF